MTQSGRGERAGRAKFMPEVMRDSYSMLVEAKRRLPKVEATHEAARVHRRLLR